MIVSCTRKDGIDSGRPRGGFIIFWRKWLNSYVFPVSHSKEFCRIDLKIGSQTYSLFNVYFPCDNRSIDSLVVFRETLANLSTTLDDLNISKVIIIGDMNTHPNRGQYWAELSDFTSSYNFKFADITNLPIDSFTFYSSANDVVSWIDHILVSDLDIVSNIQIRNDLTISDHFPISCELGVELDASPIMTDCDDTNDVRKFIPWGSLSNKQIDEYANTLRANSEYILYYEIFKCTSKCNEAHCKDRIKVVYDEVIQVMHLSSEDLN